jgi:hypothetical protein
LRGLAITGFSGHGVVVDGSENHLECLFVGVDPTGTEPAGNGGHGIAVVGGHSNRVGGPQLEDGNLLSANGGYGLYVEDALDTRRQHNAIGVDILGNPRLPNGDAALPALNPPPAPSPLDPRSLARITRILEGRIADLLAENARALEHAGLYEKYAALVARDPTGAPPADLAELVLVLPGHPELYAAFTQDAAAALAQERAEAAAYLALLGRVFRQALPSFGRDALEPPEDRRDLQSELLATFDPDDYVVSTAPKQLVAVENEPGIIVNPLVWHSLQTYGPASASSSLSNLLNVRTCEGTSAPCFWPTAYDLLPFSTQLLWQSAVLTQQEMEDIVQEDGYQLFLRVNGHLLYGGPPSGTQGVDPLVLQLQGYAAATVPGEPCPPGHVCLSTNVLARKVLANIPQPWTFELKVMKLTELQFPIVVGIDEFGNPILATHQSELYAQAARTVQPNPQTGGQHWFSETLLDTFHHPRCADCHGFGNFDAIAAHHGYSNTQSFVNGTDLHLEPSAYVPGGHVMACVSCHIVPSVDNHGNPFHELEWIAPYFDLDIDWSQKNAAQICARVKQNLPTKELRHEHFHGDGRLFWAIENPITPAGTLPAAPPQDFDDFLRRVDMWNQFGAPCP